MLDQDSFTTELTEQDLQEAELELKTVLTNYINLKHDGGRNLALMFGSIVGQPIGPGNPNELGE